MDKFARVVERLFGSGVYIPMKHVVKRALCLMRGVTDAGKNVYLSPLAQVAGPSRLRLADDVAVYRGARLDSSVNGSYIEVGESTIICESAMLKAMGGHIKLGRGCSVNSFCVLYGHGGLTIGDGVMIAAHTVIVPANHLFDDPGLPIRMQGETKKGVTVGDDVWIGANVTILDGVTIGDGSVIGAGSVVTKDVPPMSVAVGNPARVLRRRGGI
jgi:carbonic anhydrase/acetyltransferase-like protein (isoleucine patch superfamily)